MPETIVVAGETIRMEEKHPLAIRWMHWINFPVLFTMIWSGFIIYWQDEDIARLHSHQLYRVGVGGFTLFRFFPHWFVKLLKPEVAMSKAMGWHFLLMWVFAINGLVYVLYLAFSGSWRQIVPRLGSVKDAAFVVLSDLRLTKTRPVAIKYNAAQKIAYTLVLLMGVGALVTGVAIFKPMQMSWLTRLVGGYQAARLEHFWLTIGFCGFFFVHLAQVALAGWENAKAMVSGVVIRPLDAVPFAKEKQNR